ncbi:MAG TPA: POTRA domain-containing protein, partial [Alphaproteobacteria bacterium]|nr:POTRA domain-containing protein [Alphaproteobacteria bacterium]
MLAPVYLYGQNIPTITGIRVEGIQRIEADTVRSYLGIKAGDPLDIGLIDQALKSLYSTGFFADVQIIPERNGLIVRVKENPIINRVAFEGNRRIEDKTLTSEVQLRPRIIYTPAKAIADPKRIQEVYRRSGRFAATVTPKIIELDQNRVDLVFEINE